MQRLHEKEYALAMRAGRLVALRMFRDGVICVTFSTKRALSSRFLSYLHPSSRKCLIEEFSRSLSYALYRADGRMGKVSIAHSDSSALVLFRDEKHSRDLAIARMTLWDHATFGMRHEY
jgi:hypothetical protein